jgi:hypothetical protein
VSPWRNDPTLAALMASIETQESGGNPTARNARTGAYGRYQIMPQNWEPWSKEALGEVVERTPENQHRVAQYKLAQYTREFGPEGAAVAWYAGPARARQWLENPDDPWFDRKHGDGSESSVREYVQSVTGRMEQQAPPQPDRTARLATALRNAHAAGDTAAAQRFAAAIMQARGQQAPPQPDRTAQLATALRNAHAAGDTAAARRFAQEIQQTYAALSPQPAAQEAPPEAPAAPTPREQGRASVEGKAPGVGHVGAALQGFGSMVFGVGTPLTAAAELVESRLDPRRESLSPGQAMEYARGVRQGAQEEFPKSYYTGMGGGLVGSVGAVRAGVSRAPEAVRSVFALQRGQKLKNAARTGAIGAAAAGTTAGLEQGADAVLPAAAVGAVAAPALMGGAGAVVGGVRRIGRDNAALNVLAKRIGTSVDELATRVSEFRQQFRRGPGIGEIIDRHSAEELALLAQTRVGARAGRVFREAEEAAARTRPAELSEAVRRTGPTADAATEGARLRAVRGEAEEVVGRRVQSTEGAQVGRRDVRMDATMQEIGQHRVPLSDDMLEVVQHPDVWNSLDPALRRRVGAAIEQGQDIGTVDLAVSTWDAIRQELAAKAGPGAGLIYSRLRDKLRNYVSEAVPEYGRALAEYGRRTDVARGTTAGRAALTTATREFGDMLRTAGGGTPTAPTRPGVRAAEQVGARVGARTALADAFRGTPEQADAMMARLARDEGLRSNLRAALSPREWGTLSNIARQYGHQLDFTAGVEHGRRALRGGNTEGFEGVLRLTRPGATESSAAFAEGTRRGTRSALADMALENQGSAVGTAQALAESAALQQRLTTALGGDAAAHLGRLGASASRSARNLMEMAPRNSEAQQRRIAQAQTLQTIIGAGVIATGRSSGAFRANTAHELIQLARMLPGTAQRAAEMATDPAQADKVIRMLRARGVSEERILRLYRDAAVAAGIISGKVE